MPTRAERIQQKENYAIKQAKIAGLYGTSVKSVKHAEHSALTCGSSVCVMCGNPRKMFDDKTIQEKSFDQTKIWED